MGIVRNHTCSVLDWAGIHMVVYVLGSVTDHCNDVQFIILTVAEWHWKKDCYKAILDSDHALLLCCALL